MRGRSWQEEVATLFGSGYLRPAPGTWGSLAALPPGVLLLWFGGFWGLLAGTVIATAVGIYAAAHHTRRTGTKDPSEVVIDELAGQWIALLPLGLFGEGHLWYGWIVALALFRLFDVLKPWPCESLERLPEGWGVMCDDLMAGIYAALGMCLILLGAQHV
ncbi:MAG: phosphatidylglycerophosphatase A [Kiloniellales bacterium]